MGRKAKEDCSLTAIDAIFRQAQLLSVTLALENFALVIDAPESAELTALLKLLLRISKLSCSSSLKSSRGSEDTRQRVPACSAANRRRATTGMGGQGAGAARTAMTSLRGRMRSTRA